MAADDSASALVAIGLGAADIVEDPVPVALMLGVGPAQSLPETQPSLAELIVVAEKECNLPVLGATQSHPIDDLALPLGQFLAGNPPYSGNCATALVDSPLDSEWCFTMTAYIA